MTVHFDKVKWSLRPANNSLKQTNKQTNSSQLRQRKRRRLYAVTVHYYKVTIDICQQTNKQPTTQEKEDD